MHARLIKSTLFSAALVLTALTACASGPRGVTGELPQVTLDGLERQEEQITLLLGLRNINDRPLPLTEVEVELNSGDARIVTATHRPDFEIGARGREVLRMDGNAEPEGLRLLEPATNGNTRPGRISWSMQVHLTDERGRSRTTEASGYLHPVPGQPGRFR